MCKVYFKRLAVFQVLQAVHLCHPQRRIYYTDTDLTIILLFTDDPIIHSLLYNAKSTFFLISQLNFLLFFLLYFIYAPFLFYEIPDNIDFERLFVKVSILSSSYFGSILKLDYLASYCTHSIW